MKKMRMFKTAELESFLKKVGFKIRNSAGSHRQYINKKTGAQCTIAISQTEFTAKHIRSILLELGIDMELFVNHFYGKTIAKQFVKQNEKTNEESNGDSNTVPDKKSIFTSAKITMKKHKKVEPRIIDGDDSINVLQLSPTMLNRCNYMEIKTVSQLFDLMKFGTISDNVRAELHSIFENIKVSESKEKKLTKNVLSTSSPAIKNEGLIDSAKKASTDEKRERNRLRGIQRRANQERDKRIAAIHKSIKSKLRSGDKRFIKEIRRFALNMEDFRLKSLSSSLRQYGLSKTGSIKQRRTIDVDFLDFLPPEISPARVLFFLTSATKFGSITVTDALIDKVLTSLDLSSLLYEENETETNQDNSL